MNIYLVGCEQLEYILGNEVNSIQGREVILNHSETIDNEEKIYLSCLYLFSDDIVTITLKENTYHFIEDIKLNGISSTLCEIESRIPSMYLDSDDSDLYGRYIYNGLKELNLIPNTDKKLLLVIDYFGFPGASKCNINTIEYVFKYYKDNQKYIHTIKIDT